MKKLTTLVLLVFLSNYSFGQQIAVAYNKNHVTQLQVSADNPVDAAKTSLPKLLGSSYVFEDTKGKLTVLLSQSGDSVKVSVSVINNSKASFYVDAATPITYNWSPKGDLLTIEYGSDMNSFNEDEFSVAQIKGGETKQFAINVPSKTTKFKMNVKVSYYQSPVVAPESVVLNSSIRQKRGNWNWSQYTVPVLLK
jgi:galactose mutarotase-like enzyme